MKTGKGSALDLFLLIAGRSRAIGSIEGLARPNPCQRTLRSGVEVNGIGHAGSFGLARETFECELFRRVFHERHFSSLKEPRLRANDALDLPQFHFASPETILSKRNALGRRFVRAGRLLLRNNTCSLDKKAHGKKGGRFHR